VAGVLECRNQIVNEIWLEVFGTVRFADAEAQLPQRRQRQTMAASAWLEAVGLVVEGLEQIEEGCQRLTRLTRLGRSLLREAFRLWQASEQSTRDTRHLVMLFSVWKHAARAISVELQQTWLPTWEKHLASLHPETELKELAESVRLVSQLFPDNYGQRASVVQVADNLEKHWRTARRWPGERLKQAQKAGGA
jgi:hypothetical protein